MAIRALFFSLILAAAAFSEEAPLLVGSDSLTPADTAAGPQFTEAVTFERNEFASSAHEYLGWAAVTMGLATGLSAGALAGEPSHEAMGYSAAGLAAATLATGFWAHYGEIGQKGSSSNNIHTLLGILGGSLMAATPFLAPGDAHMVAGMGGTLLMTVAVSWKIIF